MLIHDLHTEEVTGWYLFVFIVHSSKF